MSEQDSNEAIRVENLEAWYGDSQALHGMSFTVGKGQTVSLLGRNGAGKTTTLRSLMGMLRHRRGSVLHGGVETITKLPRQIARMGVGYVPEERGIYASLTVRENLLLPPVIEVSGFTLSDVLTMFPNLQERLASQGTKLSGGEQQMLAIARVLRTGSKVLLLDEPTEGLAPVIVQQIQRTIAELKSRGYTIVLVEQNVRFAADVADLHLVVEQGKVVDTVPQTGFEDLVTRLGKYLGL